MKKKWILGLSVLALTMPTNVSAKGSATISFTGSDSVVIGDTFKVYMSVENILDTKTGIVALGGQITYDKEKIEYIEAKNLNTPYAFQINPEVMKFAGLDYTLENGMKTSTNIYEFTFKAKKEGLTTISVENSEICDQKEHLTSRVQPKQIEIKEPIKEEKKQVTKKINVVSTTKKLVKKENKKENENKEKVQKINKFVHNFLKKLTQLMK